MTCPSAYGPFSGAASPTASCRAQQAVRETFCMYLGTASRARAPTKHNRVQQAVPESLLYVYERRKPRPSPYCMYTSAGSRARVPTVCIRAQQAALECLRTIFGRGKSHPSVIFKCSQTRLRTCSLHTGAASCAHHFSLDLWAQQGAPSYSSCDWRVRFDFLQLFYHPNHSYKNKNMNVYVKLCIIFCSEI